MKKLTFWATSPLLFPVGMFFAILSGMFGDFSKWCEWVLDRFSDYECWAYNRPTWAEQLRKMEKR